MANQSLFDNLANMRAEGANWWDRWAQRGVPVDALPDLVLRIRLANWIVLVLLGLSVTYFPCYLIFGLDQMAWATAGMGLAWGVAAFCSAAAASAWAGTWRCGPG